jgi:hypothetical protein
MLLPDRVGDDFRHCFSQRRVADLSQLVEQSGEAQPCGGTAHTRNRVFGVSIRIVQFKHQLVVGGHIRCEKSVAGFNPSSVQINRDCISQPIRVIEPLTKKCRRGLLAPLPETVSFSRENRRRGREDCECVAQTHRHDQEKLQTKESYAKPPWKQRFCFLPLVSYLLYFSRTGVTSLTSASESSDGTWVGRPAVVTWVGLPPPATWVGLPAVVMWVGLPAWLTWVT